MGGVISLLEKRISDLSAAIRSGAPRASDEEYKRLLAEHRSQYGSARHEAYLRTHLEPGSNVRHRFVIGALEKIKHSTDISNFLDKTKYQPLFCVEDIGGLSFVATYIDGQFASGATRGDGHTGVDITGKLRHLLPLSIGNKGIFTIRGVLTTTCDDHLKMNFKNRRPATAELITRSNAVPSAIRMVKAIIYRILEGEGAALSLQWQHNSLAHIGFWIPSQTIISPHPQTETVADKVSAQLCAFLENQRTQDIYDCDGVVICPLNEYSGENKLIPSQMVVFVPV